MYTHTHTPPILFEHQGWSETHRQFWIQVEVGSDCSRQLSVHPWAGLMHLHPLHTWWGVPVIVGVKEAVCHAAAGSFPTIATE